MSRNTSKGFKLRDATDYYDLEGIENYNTQKADDLISDIESKMMSGTNSTDNQLANKDFVNSSISHSASYFRGNWSKWGDVPTDPNLYPSDGEGNKKPGVNDYMVVVDMSTYTNPDEPSRVYEGTWRFKYVGEWDDPIPGGGTRGKNGWKPEYQVNEKPLTQEQLLALNSGATSQKITSYDAHVADYTNPHQVTAAQVGLDNVDNTSDVNKPISTAQQTALDGKIDIDQGTSYAGKFLGVGNDGKVVPKDIQGGATPEQLATKLDKKNRIQELELVFGLPENPDPKTLYFIPDGGFDGLKFTATADNSSVGYDVNGTIDKDIWKSTDGGETWSQWDGTSVSLNNGDSLCVWNKKSTLSTSSSNYFRFTTSGSLKASGDVSSMINWAELTPYCYKYLFDSCRITTAPDLPAMTLASHCYDDMFYNCIKLTTPPDLPATTLAEGCYSSMFFGCQLLLTPPDLPATTLSRDCYNAMFVSCYRLTKAPDLPATTLAINCYFEMFYDCANINSLKIAYTGQFSNNYMDDWLKDVASTGTLYYNGADTSRGDSAIPQNWAVQSF